MPETKPCAIMARVLYIQSLTPTVAEFQNIREQLTVVSVCHSGGVIYVSIDIAISCIALLSGPKKLRTWFG